MLRTQLNTATVVLTGWLRCKDRNTNVQISAAATDCATAVVDDSAEYIAEEALQHCAVIHIDHYQQKRDFCALSLALDSDQAWLARGIARRIASARRSG